MRTQIEELFALYRLYPLPEFESVGRPTVTRSRITIHCLQRLSSETRMHEQWRSGRKSKQKRAGERRGLRSLAACPIPPPRNSRNTKPSTVAGSGPNTRNPAGGADGAGLAASGEDRRQILTTGQRGSGGRAVQVAITISRAPAGKVQCQSPAILVYKPLILLNYFGLYGKDHRPPPRAGSER